MAAEVGVTPDFVTMLRHPAETLTSARKSYGTYAPAASRAAAWANVALETELATRGSRRAFIRYDDLLADWRRGGRPPGRADRHAGDRLAGRRRARPAWTGSSTPRCTATA